MKEVTYLFLGSSGVAALTGCVVDQVIIRNDLLPLLITPIKSSNPIMRLHGLLALKNLAFWSESSLKELLMNHLTWAYLAMYGDPAIPRSRGCIRLTFASTNVLLLSLCNDPDLDIQAQALGILRNVACNKEADVDLPMSEIGKDKYLSMLEDKLQSPSDHILIVVSVSSRALDSLSQTEAADEKRETGPQTLNILQNLVQSPKGKQAVLQRQSLLFKMLDYIVRDCSVMLDAETTVLMGPRPWLLSSATAAPRSVSRRCGRPCLWRAATLDIQGVCVHDLFRSAVYVKRLRLCCGRLHQNRMKTRCCLSRSGLKIG